MQIIIMIGVTLLTINLIVSNIVIMRLKEYPKRLLPWLTIINLVPIGGFLVYLLFGLSLKSKTKIALSKNAINARVNLKNTQEKFSSKKYQKNIDYLNALSSLPTINAEKIDFFSFGEQMFTALKKDILTAKKSIWISSYIFADDEIGKKLLDLLCLKARFGLDVKLLYDSAGSIGTSKKFFQLLTKSGGTVKEFFPPLWNIKALNFRFNYRNHRKIVIIDDKIVYTGGINYRNDHFGYDKNLSPWRDTQIRLFLPDCSSFKAVFIGDWNYLSKIKLPAPTQEKTLNQKQNYILKVVDSAPSYCYQNIRNNFINLINLAQKQIVIESPYFIPDETIMHALSCAIKRGVKCIIILPNKPDKKLIYYASLSFLKTAVKLGAVAKLYDGFMHSKLIIIDDDISSIGTTNFDERSFNLNFEVNVNVYNKKKTSELFSLVKKDINNSQEFTLESYKKLKPMQKYLGSLLKLFSTLL